MTIQRMDNVHIGLDDARQDFAILVGLAEQLG